MQVMASSANHGLSALPGVWSPSVSCAKMGRWPPSCLDVIDGSCLTRPLDPTDPLYLWGLWGWPGQTRPGLSLSSINYVRSRCGIWGFEIAIWH